MVMAKFKATQVPFVRALTPPPPSPLPPSSLFLPLRLYHLPAYSIPLPSGDWLSANRNAQRAYQRTIECKHSGGKALGGGGWMGVCWECELLSFSSTGTCTMAGARPTGTFGPPCHRLPTTHLGWPTFSSDRPTHFVCFGTDLLILWI